MDASIYRRITATTLEAISFVEYIANKSKNVVSFFNIFFYSVSNQMYGNRWIRKKIITKHYIYCFPFELLIQQEMIDLINGHQL